MAASAAKMIDKATKNRRGKTVGSGLLNRLRTTLCIHNPPQDGDENDINYQDEYKG
jgi:hypothetical protein